MKEEVGVLGGGPVPNSPYGLGECKATLNERTLIIILLGGETLRNIHPPLEV